MPGASMKAGAKAPRPLCMAPAVGLEDGIVLQVSDVLNMPERPAPSALAVPYL
jgi:hypothetical protein